MASLIPFSIEKGANTSQQIAEMSIAAIACSIENGIIWYFAVLEVSFWAITAVAKLLLKFLTLII